MFMLLWFTLALLAAPAVAQPQPENELLGSQTRPAVTSSRAVWPSGWRRTTRGWERSEEWAAPAAFAGEAAAAQASITGSSRSLYDWIHLGRERERNWIHRGSVAVRAIHPALLGLMLVVSALVIARASAGNTAQEITCSGKRTF